MKKHRYPIVKQECEDWIASEKDDGNLSILQIESEEIVEACIKRREALMESPQVSFT